MFENTTYSVLLNRMLDRVSGKFDKREGSVIWDTHSPTAIELQILYQALDTVISETFGDTASRDFLIQRCKERGITPYSATYAMLHGEFTPTNIDVTGKRFNIGLINYTAKEKISDGVYRVECETVGAEGNRYLGNMVPIEYINGLQRAELTEVLIPGEDEEGTEELRQRYFDSFSERAFGGNAKDYLKNTNAIPGVGSTKVTRVWNSDLRPAEMIPSSEVDTWYTQTLPGLSDAVKNWLVTTHQAATEKKLTVGGTVLLTILDAEFNPASDALIELVQQTIDPEQYGGEGYGLAPIGHLVNVKSADAVPVKVITALTFEQGESWDSLQYTIDEVVSDYLLELRKEWADSEYLIIRISQIETRILSIRGVLDIAGTSLNGIIENLILDRHEIPVFGGVSE